LTSRVILAGLLCLVLLIESVVLVSSGVLGNGLAFSALFSIVVGIINAVAFMDVARALTKLSDNRNRRVAGSVVKPPRKPWDLASVIVGQASVIPFLYIPLWTEWKSGEHDAQDIWICLLAATGLAIAVFVTVLAINARPSDSLNKGWVLVVALLPLVGFAQSWYSTSYKPAHQRPDINIVASLDGIGSAASVSRLKATITLENDGPTDVDFFGAVYTVTSFSLMPVDHALVTKQELGALPDLKVAALSRNKSQESYQGLLKAGALIRPGGHLVPGQKLRTSFIFDVKNRAQSKLRLTVLLSALVDNGKNLEPAQPCEAPPKYPNECHEIAVPIRGWLRTKLSDQPVAQTIFAYQPGELPSLTTQFLYADRTVQETDKLLKLEGVYPSVNTRGFTTSVEFSPPLH
jgi:hypothetical protein